MLQQELFQQSKAQWLKQENVRISLDHPWINVRKSVLYTPPPLLFMRFKHRKMKRWDGTNVDVGVSSRNERLCAIIRTVRTTDTTTVQHESSPQLLKIDNSSWYPHRLRHRRGKPSVPRRAPCSSRMYRSQQAVSSEGFLFLRCFRVCQRADLFSGAF